MAKAPAQIWRYKTSPGKAGKGRNQKTSFHGFLGHLSRGI
jgi:hypothetical protein